MKTEEKTYFIAVQKIFPIQKHLCEKIDTHIHGDWKKFFYSSKQDLIQMGLSEKVSEKFCVSRKTLDPEKLLSEIQSLSIEVCLFNEDIYPELLSETQEAPGILFLKGNTNILTHKKTLSIVGSRKISPYGKKALEYLFQDLKDNCTIVSGFALGIDTHAHECALKHNAPTICVLGNGLDRIYPSQNRRLAEELLQENKGLFLSEYFPGTPPLPHHFPTRNRIVAGLSSTTIIIEAQKKSGSLITARLALEENRDVFAIPGDIFSASSQGCNHLIAKGEAMTLLSGKQILKNKGIETRKDHLQKTLPLLNEIETALIEKIREHGSIHKDKLLQDLPFSKTDISSHLVLLELNDCIHTQDPHTYSLNEL